MIPFHLTLSKKRAHHSCLEESLPKTSTVKNVLDIVYLFYQSSRKHNHRSITNIHEGIATLSPECSFRQYKKVIKLIECVQKRVAKIVKGLKGKTYMEKLKSPGLFSL